MKVGRLQDWLKHLDKGDTMPREVYQNWGAIDEDNQIWKVGSQQYPNVFYTLTFYRNGQGIEFIRCNCMAARTNQKCKHAATVLAQIHAVEFRAMLRQRSAAKEHQRVKITARPKPARS